MRKILLTLVAIGLLLMGTIAHAEEIVIFSFEDGMEGWEIPDWAYEKTDYAQKGIDISDKYASNGKNSLEMQVDFVGGRWAGAITEIMQYFDWTTSSKIACDIYIPADAPMGLKAKMILTVGDSWTWCEMSRSYNLKPGEWITLTADLKPGTIDWKRTEVDDAFRQDVRKIDIRIESNNKPAYTGPVYIDNIRLME
ncbi:MAG: glycan-binding surface protein [Candidatus Omnitrophota bacterium]